MKPQKSIEEKIQEQPLTFRLRAAMDMIGDMCKEGRCPKMSIPVRWEDEDVFISTTLQDAIDRIEMKDKKFNVVLYDQVNSKPIHEVVVHCFSKRDAKILGQAEFIKNALNIDDFETIVTEIQ